MDLPIKKGLSSSAAICITIAKAYNYLYDLNLSDVEIKNIAYEGEHLAKSKCGRLDQETIMNNGICYITFGLKRVKSRKIKVKKDMYILAIDLNKQKNTKEIINRYHQALPFPKDGNDQLMLDIIGNKNKKLVEMAEQAIESGDVEKLGYALTEAQKLMDNAAVACKEYYTPVLHSVLEDEFVKEHSYGGKSNGSGGEGTLLLICKNKNSEEELKRYIYNKFNMSSISFCINKNYN